MTKAGGKGRCIQVPLELVRNPIYRVYAAMDEELLRQLAEQLQKKESYFTPCLGLSEMVAAFQYVGLMDLSPGELPSQVNSVIPLELFEIEVEPGKEYMKETHSVSMNADRQVTGFLTMAYERNQQSIKVVKAREDGLIWQGEIKGHLERIILI